MKKRKAFLFTISTLFLVAFAETVTATDFQMTDCSEASGYYYTKESGFVFMDNGTVYEINSETLEAEKAKESYNVFSNGKDFIITLGENALYLQEQSEKGITEEGERYYAVYSDFEGTVDNAKYQEGSNFLVDDYYLFGMHYTVAKRQSIGRFLNIESDEIAGSSEVGFDTPEEAVNAYLEAFQRKDVEGMISTFAMDTYVEHFRLDKQIERYSAYYYSLGLPNSNEYVWQLSKEQRRAVLTNALIGSYWRYAAPELTYGKQELISGSEEEFSGAEFLAESFYNEGYIDTITLTGTFLNPMELEPKYEETLQKNSSWQEVYGGNEIRDIVAVLSIENKDFIQCMSVIRYGEKWYNLQLSGYIGSILGIPASYAGLISLEELQNDDY